MGKIPHTLRQTIATNIRHCRMEKFPGRGGAKKCAETFGVSPQQWSPWERGMRTPDETRLSDMAEFFGVSVEWLRRDHGVSGFGVVGESKRTGVKSPSGVSSVPGPSSPDIFSYLYHNRMKAVYRVEVMVTDVQYVPLH